MKLKPAAWKKIFPKERQRNFEKGEIMVEEGGVARELLVI